MAGDVDLDRVDGDRHWWRIHDGRMNVYWFDFCDLSMMMESLELYKEPSNPFWTAVPASNKDKESTLYKVDYCIEQK